MRPWLGETLDIPEKLVKDTGFAGLKQLDATGTEFKQASQEHSPEKRRQYTTSKFNRPTKHGGNTGMKERFMDKGGTLDEG